MPEDEILDMHPCEHQYVDRTTGLVCTERLYGDWLLNSLYTAAWEHAPALHRALTSARFSSLLCESQKGQLAQKLQSLLGQTDKGGIRRAGNEDVEFLFSANPGEELRPMNGVASGGELSRLMLALKTITAPSLFPKTLIFDEIDVGIGGKVADAVGMRLRRLAKTNQVLCVTHQLQIARYADAHFLVNKDVVNGRTLTKVVELDEQGRIEELARMIGGSEVTASARKHVKELIKSVAVEN